MLIRIPTGWKMPEREATPEHVYLSRRQLIVSAGFIGAGRLLAQTVDRSIFPAKRNPAFKLDRLITEERAATSYNNFYEFDMQDKQAVKDKVGRFVTSPWAVEVTGLINKPQKLDLDDLMKKLPVEERLYRFRCVEAWAMAVPWTGFPFSALAKLVEPKPEAKFVRFVTVHRPDQMPGIRQYNWYSWPYYEGLRLDEAMNPLALVAVGLYGKPLPKQNGAPVRMVLPWKYGFKSIKSIVKIEFTAKQPNTFWNESQPKEYGFHAIINPNVPHPRWSQATERLIPSGEKRPTQLFNGYGEWVAGLYGSKIPY